MCEQLSTRWQNGQDDKFNYRQAQQCSSDNGVRRRLHMENMDG